MKLKWEIDSANTIEARLGGFGRNVVTVNGIEVPGKLSMRKKSELPLSLNDGRQALLSVTPQFVTQPIVELRVEGQLLIETRKETTICNSCGKAIRPNDRFCASCGQSLPTAEDYVNQRRVKEATGVIKGLAWLFLVAGIIMFFVTKSKVSAALIKLSGMSPDSLLPGGKPGVTVTVAALRDQLLWQPWGVLIVNLILAAVMAGLAYWGRKVPLAAVLVATATYSVLIVVNAVIDPRSIGEGLYMKIIIIALLVKGVKSALALRQVNA